MLLYLNVMLDFAPSKFVRVGSYLVIFEWIRTYTQSKDAQALEQLIDDPQGGQLVVWVPGKKTRTWFAVRATYAL